MRSITSLPHSLEIRVNAGGVEAACRLHLPQEHGCDEFQGFLLARPVAPGALTHSHAASDLGAKYFRADASRAGSPTLLMPLGA